ncbi:MAG: hypothetical protein PSX80_03940, partial [bacterium]|nr:hypothetical protein [bacterium]
MKKPIKLTFFLSISCFLWSPAESQAQPVRGSGPSAGLVDVGGGRLWMESAGSGGPTVVLDYGLG